MSNAIRNQRGKTTMNTNGVISKRIPAVLLISLLVILVGCGGAKSTSTPQSMLGNWTISTTYPQGDGLPNGGGQGTTSNLQVNLVQGGTSQGGACTVNLSGWGQFQVKGTQCFLAYNGIEGGASGSISGTGTGLVYPPQLLFLGATNQDLSFLLVESPEPSGSNETATYEYNGLLTNNGMTGGWNGPFNTSGTFSGSQN
jgi:hypothetical protein